MKKLVKFCKNIFIIFFVKLFRIYIKHHLQQERFLVVSTTGLGDTLWATPSIRSLREHYPKAYIAVLTSPIGKELLENHPYINDVLAFKRPIIRSLFFLYPTLRKKNFSHILLFHYSQRIILPFICLLGSKKIIGTEGLHKGLDSLVTQLLPRKPQHEILRRLEIVASLIDKNPVHHHIEIAISPQDIKNTYPLIGNVQNRSSPHILFHPGSKDHFKRWPASHFISLGQLLYTHHKCKIFITGNRSEKELVSQIASKIPNSISLIEIPLKTFAALIQQIDLMVCNDTGPMHIGFATKTPTVAIFCPTDPYLCGPYNAKNHTIIVKKKTCFPCLQKRCANPFCMLQIEIREVYEAVLHQLEKLY